MSSIASIRHRHSEAGASAPTFSAERNIPSLTTYRSRAEQQYTYRRPPTPGVSAVDVQTQVRDIEHRVQTKVIREIIHQRGQEKTQADMLAALLSPKLLQTVADRVFAANLKRSAIERYRRGDH